MTNTNMIDGVVAAGSSGGEGFFHEPMGNAIGMLTQVAPFCANEMPNVWAG